MTFNAEALPFSLLALAAGLGIWLGRHRLQEANKKYSAGPYLPDRWVSVAAAVGVLATFAMAMAALFLPLA